MFKLEAKLQKDAGTFLKNVIEFGHSLNVIQPVNNRPGPEEERPVDTLEWLQLFHHINPINQDN